MEITYQPAAGIFYEVELLGSTEFGEFIKWFDALIIRRDTPDFRDRPVRMIIQNTEYDFSSVDDMEDWISGFEKCWEMAQDFLVLETPKDEFWF